MSHLVAGVGPVANFGKAGPLTGAPGAVSAQLQRERKPTLYWLDYGTRPAFILDHSPSRNYPIIKISALIAFSSKSFCPDRHEVS